MSRELSSERPCSRGHRTLLQASRFLKGPKHRSYTLYPQRMGILGKVKMSKGVPEMPSDGQRHIQLTILSRWGDMTTVWTSDSFTFTLIPAILTHIRQGRSYWSAMNTTSSEFYCTAKLESGS